ncbi:STAS domain-containing protein [Agaribacter marinus]|uniref:Chemotaxis locus anti-sigma factor antagonist n=1 Tax=Agaribacter marinus TaxID=1431249 RepID=A0AA37SXC6_9ALTE|nr:STAS domain-containing protein [Agaribacter marinus]GLR71487.1 chemotaxis locus anti-sigma factor antagonist [Agaribacter marinus]
MSEKSLSIPERFDFGYHKEFTEQYQRILNEGGISDIALDFTKVSYLDSSALGMMVLFQKKAKSQNISVRIRGARESAKEILLIANFDRLFDIS